MTATKLDFFNALKQAVIFSPQCAERCKQLQTFRVIETGGGALINSANFGATVCDKDKPFFWSRRWHERKYSAQKVDFEFPALSIVETSYTVDQPLNASNKRCYEFNIAVLDKYAADCEKMKCTGCTGRTINEVYEDTENLLFQALAFVGGFMGATLTPGGEGFYHEGLLNAWKQAGFIQDFVPGKRWGSKIAQNVKDATAYKVSLDSAKMYGNAINITVCFDTCENTEYRFENAEEFALLSKSAGCQNCG